MSDQHRPQAYTGYLAHAIDPELWSLPRIPSNNAVANNTAESTVENMEYMVGEEFIDWHGGGRSPNHPNPHDESLIYDRRRDPYEPNQADHQTTYQPGQPLTPTYANSLTDDPYPSNPPITGFGIRQDIPRPGASSTSLSPAINLQPPRDPPITATGHLLQNANIHGHVLNERGDQQPRSQSVESSVDREQPLTINHPETQKLLGLVVDKAYLSDIIKYIVNADWYQETQETQEPQGEQLPPGDLRNVFRNKKSVSSANSPFSAFFEHKRRLGYHCLFCNDGQGRSLERALGHSRDHFNFKPINGYTNQNTKNDQVRRANNAKRPCNICGIDISSQNYGRHTRSKSHKTVALAVGSQ